MARQSQPGAAALQIMKIFLGNCLLSSSFRPFSLALSPSPSVSPSLPLICILSPFFLSPGILCSLLSSILLSLSLHLSPLLFAFILRSLPLSCSLSLSFLLSSALPLSCFLSLSFLLLSLSLTVYLSPYLLLSISLLSPALPVSI